MTTTSKIDICNMSLGHLGNFGTIQNIDTPSNDKEITFALWYDISRQTMLKLLMPNFALARKVVAQVVIPAPFGVDQGYQQAYEYPADCLKVLGIGEVKDKENNYAIEGNLIWTDQAYPNGLPLRYIKDIEDVTMMSPEFKMTFSLFLASNACMDITQDANKAKLLLQMLPEKISTLSGLNAQENMPIRKSVSRFRQSRWTGFVSEPQKR
jgi:hypothetical protein